jgi:sugar phosphate isomerase/epimerase
LYEDSDPEYFYSEIDTYWIVHGGGDPAEWIRSLKDRASIVHFKDMTMKGNTQIMAEVGEGNLNWSAIISACQQAGTDWYIVEQDTCQRDPFDSLAISLSNLKQMGIH